MHTGGGGGEKARRGGEGEKGKAAGRVHRTGAFVCVNALHVRIYVCPGAATGSVTSALPAAAAPTN